MQKTKSLFFLLFAVSFTSGLVAQKVKPDGINFYMTMVQGSKFNEAVIEKLKNTTTVFFYRTVDHNRKDSLENIIQKVWTYNKIILAPYSDVNKYYTEEYSHFAIEAEMTTTNYNKPNTYTNTHVFLTLKLPAETSKKGTVLYKRLCRVELFVGIESAKELNDRERRFKNKKTLPEFIIDDCDLKNWSPALIGLYLKKVQHDLNESMKPNHYEQKKLQDYKMLKDTLLILQDVMFTQNGFFKAVSE